MGIREWVKPAKVAAKRREKIRREIGSISVYEMMSKDVIVIDSQNSLSTLADVLKERGISSVPVVEHDELVGIVGKEDVLGVSGADSLDSIAGDSMERLRATKVRDVMKKPVTIFCRSSIDKAADMMKMHSVDRLVVVDEEKKMVGLVSNTDLVRGASKVIVKRRMETTMDEVLDAIKKRGSMTMAELAEKFHVDRAVVEDWARILEEHNLVVIDYPMIGKPSISMAREPK